jgi:hypothetical protein
MKNRLTTTMLMIGFVTGIADCATFAPAKTADVRKVTIVRTYSIPAVGGKKTVAAVPALISFWGATNQQVIVDSSFTYSVNPDNIAVTADDLGMKRRNYELTWESPAAGTITVTQKLTVELSRAAMLPTVAKLPYPEEVSTTYASSLASTKTVNLDNEALDGIVKAVKGKNPWAEETVELVCDWVNDNIKFQSGAPGDSDAVLKNKYGNCEGMSNVACAVLRKMGIPAETVTATFLGGNGHGFIEVYFPDAGWVFYDLSNGNRGFKSLDCLLTAGWGIRVGDGIQDRWIEGSFLATSDASAYKEDDRLGSKLRAGPKKENVVGAKVVHVKPPVQMKVRRWPINSLIMDLTVPPGKRAYRGDDPSSSTRPASRTPSSLPAKTTGSSPSAGR